ncbi:cupin domain-containing protein [Cellulophaga baltica]|uniref:cupin domain-containing protein n=1 Tax=Cellulophaga baltica TaxID=76594 RepID=UPI00046F3A28|nr:cupin domain-containing protein [Cellulophaga baltica]AIY14584.1 cupin [Cellulophaga baltica NN016038]
MKTASITANLNYLEDRPAVSVLLKTDSTKEVRILMKKGQQMKEHKAPFPIVVSLFEGAINFGVAGETMQLKKGDLIALDASVPHDLFCTEDAIIRLTIATADSVDRVKNVAN